MRILPSVRRFLSALPACFICVSVLLFLPDEGGLCSERRRPPQEAEEESPFADVDFSAGLSDPLIQKIVERVVNEEYYSERPDPRTKTTRPLSNDEKKRVLELIPLLGNDSWEVRAKAHGDLVQLCPGAVPLVAERLGAEADPEIRWRIRQVLERFPLVSLKGTPRQLLAAGHRERRKNPARAFMCYWRAAQLQPSLANDTWLRRCAKETYYSAPDIMPGSELDDTALYLLANLEELARRFPDSPFIEDALFRLGEYEALYRAFPNGRYRAYAMYSHIAGHWYFGWRTGSLEIRNGKREIEMWPKFLGEFPDHPGANDAWYRYGRALEEGGRPLDAIRALLHTRDLVEKPLPRLRENELWPDDTLNMQQHARWRIYYIMDAMLSIEDMEKLKKELQNDAELCLQCRFTIALRHVRTGQFGKARKLFAAIVRWGIENQGEKPSEAGQIMAAASRRICWLDSEVMPHWRALANHDGTNDADEHMSAIGQAFFNSESACHNKAYDSGHYLDWWASSIRSKQYLRDCCNYLMAARIFDDTLERHPETRLRGSLLLDAALSYEQAAHYYWYWAEPVKRELKLKCLKAAIIRYERLINGCLESPLVTFARSRRAEAEEALRRYTGKQEN